MSETTEPMSLLESFKRAEAIREDFRKQKQRRAELQRAARELKRLGCYWMRQPVDYRGWYDPTGNGLAVDAIEALRLFKM